MGYQAMDWTDRNGTSDNPHTTLKALINNNLVLEAHANKQHGILSGDWYLEEPSGTFPNPPIDPFHPDRCVVYGQDMFFEIIIALTWSGDKVTEEVHYHYDNDLTLEEMDNATDTNAKLTYTYSAVSGAESIPIAGTWS